MYKLDKNRNLIWGEGISKENKVSENDLLRYGEILTDDNFEERITVDYKTKYTRIRTIKYNNHTYYHKMINGDTIEVKELT